MMYFFYARTSITCLKRLEMSGIIDALCATAAFEEVVRLASDAFEVPRNEVCIINFNGMEE